MSAQVLDSPVYKPTMATMFSPGTSSTSASVSSSSQPAAGNNTIMAMPGQVQPMAMSSSANNPTPPRGPFFVPFHHDELRQDYLHHHHHHHEADDEGDPRTSSSGKSRSKKQQAKRSSGSASSKGSGDSGKQNPLISPTEKCKVCNEPAARHIHYGSVTCFSCRAFFRRSIQNKNAKVYVCRKNGNCDVRNKLRKSCQKCRFDKCIAAGMKPSWVLSEDERNRRFRKTREKKEKMKKEKEEQKSHHDQSFATTPSAGSDSELHSYAELSYQQQQRSLSTESRTRSLSANSNTSDPDSWASSSDYQPPPAQVPRTTEPSGSFASTYGCSAPLKKRYSRMQSDPVPSEEAPPSTSSSWALSASVGRQIPIIEERFNQHQPHHHPHHHDDSPHFHAPPIPHFSERGSLPSTSKTVYPPFVAHEQVVHRYPGPAHSKWTSRITELKNEGQEEQAEDLSMHSDSSVDESVARRHQKLPKVDTLILDPMVEITEDEMVRIRTLVKKHDDSYTSVPFGEELIKEMVMCSVLGVPLSTTAAMNGYKLMIRRFQQVANCTDDFVTLPYNVQKALMKQNADLLVSLRGAVFFDVKKKGIDQILYSMGVQDIEIGKKLIGAAIKNAKKVGDMQRIDYRSFNSLQKLDADVERENRYNQLLSRVGSIMSARHEYVRLMAYVLLFSGDNCDLTTEERKHVETLRHMYVNMIKRLIFSIHPYEVAVIVFSNLLSSVSDLQELCDIKRKRMLAAPDKAMESSSS